MFKHRTWHDVFEFHELSDEEGNSIILVPERGGIITEFNIKSRPVFYLDKATLFDIKKNIRGGNPILFPICGPLKDNKYDLDGLTYEMKQHGLARNLPWTVKEINTDENSGSIALKLNSSKDTKKIYPFDFELTFKYELYDNKFNVYQCYKNLSNRPMPFYGGFHPYFKITDKQQISVDIEATKYYDIMEDKFKDYKGTLHIPEDKEFNVVFSDVINGEVSFKDLIDNTNIIVRYDENFSYIVFWTLPSRNFLCMEPWMGNNYSLNTGENVKNILPGESMNALVSYVVERL